MAQWIWTETKELAAVMTAAGKRQTDITVATGVSGRTLQNWAACPEFSARVAEIVAKFRSHVSGIAIAQQGDRILRQSADRDRLNVVMRKRAQYWVERKPKVLALIEEYEAKLAGIEHEIGEVNGRLAAPISNALMAEQKIEKSEARNRDIERLKLLDARRERTEDRLQVLRDDPCFHPGIEDGVILYKREDRGRSVTYEYVTDAPTLDHVLKLEQSVARELGQNEPDRLEHNFTKLSDDELIARAKELLGGVVAPGAAEE